MTSATRKRATERRVAGYVRVSHVGKRAGEFLSPELQREAIERWAEYERAEVVRLYSDIDVSGREGTKRPQFEQMVADALAGQFESVVVYTITRFSRSLLDAKTWLKKLDDAGVTFASLTERGFDTSTAQGRLMLHLFFALAEFESDRIGDGWRAVHERRRRAGKVHLSKPMYGYTLVRGTVGEVIPEQADAVRLAYEMRSRGLGYLAIRRALDEAGFRALNGGTFATSSLGHILKQPAYAGLLRDPSGALRDAAHQPIVGRELWDAVQATHGSDSRTNKRSGRRSAGLLSGLIRCGCCGHAMYYQEHGGGRTRQKSYRCSSSRSSMRETCGKSIAAWVAEDVVMGRWLAMQGAVLRDGGLTGLKDTAATARPKRGSTPRDPMQERRAAVERTEAAMSALVDRFTDGRISGVTFDKQVARLEARLTDQRAALAEVESAPSSIPSPSILIIDDMERLRDGLREWVEKVEVFPMRQRGGGRAAQFEEAVARVRVHWIEPVEADGRVTAIGNELYSRFAPAPGIHWPDRLPVVVKLLADLMPDEKRPGTRGGSGVKDAGPSERIPRLQALHPIRKTGRGRRR